MRSQCRRAPAVTYQYVRDSLIAGVGHPEPKPARGKKREGKYSPVTKASPLRRSNTDCEAGMNREPSAAVCADLNRNTLSSPRVSGVEECRIAVLLRVGLTLVRQSLRWGSETCSPLGVIEIKSPSCCVGGNKCSLYRAQQHFKASHSWSALGVLCCLAICCQNSVSERGAALSHIFILAIQLMLLSRGAHKWCQRGIRWNGLWDRVSNSNSCLLRVTMCDTGDERKNTVKQKKVQSFYFIVSSSLNRLQVGFGRFFHQIKCVLTSKIGCCSVWLEQSV